MTDFQRTWLGKLNRYGYAYLFHRKCGSGRKIVMSFGNCKPPVCINNRNVDDATVARLQVNVYSRTSFFSRFSKEIPFVSGIFVNTQISCNTIIKAKKAKMGQGFFPNMPCSRSKNTGVINVMVAANTQWVLAPNDCPSALILLGKISEIKTHITAPCPIACAAIKSSRKTKSKEAPACE